MQQCPGCQRHVFEDERTCPFCRRRLHSAPAPIGAALALGIVLAACSSTAGDGGGDDGHTETGESGSTTTDETGTSTGETGETTTTDTDTSDSTCNFYAGACGQDAPAEQPCDIWDPESCPEGEKCTAWAAGGATWDANKCVMVMGDGQPGDDCIATDGDPTSGNDDCAKGSMCWDIDPDTNTGYCVAFCTGSPNDPMCGDGETCILQNDGVLTICLSTCDPLMGGADCPNPDAACIFNPGGTDFMCAGQHGDGAYGSECQYVTDCDAGLFCGGAQIVPGCGGIACCTEYCDVNQPNTCAGMAQGQVCTPWWEMGMAPDGYDHVGACALP